jgi:hypothetical protein
MLDTALELDTGKYSLSQSPIILYVIRLCVRVEAFILYLKDDALCDATRGLQKQHRKANIMEQISQAQKRMRMKLNKVKLQLQYFEVFLNLPCTCADMQAQHIDCIMCTVHVHALSLRSIIVSDIADCMLYYMLVMLVLGCISNA